ncbi:hypothetical protein FB545_4700 [Peribacillus frigoritolerans]|uniref:hypothetical protein n=1 Tax=Peribacillus frigoritolerans TaxID=450367 RepID=UPI0011458694|nr:hypothetical protein [Peribacillus frigoritolerans]TWD94739.1 hypothetical protein FB545_4700 [Peribacillus frigoritolerans]
MEMELTALHWIYVVFIALIIGFMVKRRDTTLICIIGIFLLALVATGSLASLASLVIRDLRPNQPQTCFYK